MLAELDIHLNSEAIKYAVVVLAMPIWVPFMKALWQEANESLREEGGLFGEEPDADELAQMHATRGAKETPMVSDPIEERAGARGWPSRRKAVHNPFALANPDERVPTRPMGGRGFRER